MKCGKSKNLIVKSGQVLLCLSFLITQHICSSITLVAAATEDQKAAEPGMPSGIGKTADELQQPTSAEKSVGNEVKAIDIAKELKQKRIQSRSDKVQNKLNEMLARIPGGKAIKTEGIKPGWSTTLMEEGPEGKKVHTISYAKGEKGNRVITQIIQSDQAGKQSTVQIVTIDRNGELKGDTTLPYDAYSGSLSKVTNLKETRKQAEGNVEQLKKTQELLNKLATVQAKIDAAPADIAAAQKAYDDVCSSIVAPKIEALRRANDGVYQAQTAYYGRWFAGLKKKKAVDTALALVNTARAGLETAQKDPAVVSAKSSWDALKEDDAKNKAEKEKIQSELGDATYAPGAIEASIAQAEEGLDGIVQSLQAAQEEFDVLTCPPLAPAPEALSVPTTAGAPSAPPMAEARQEPIEIDAEGYTVQRQDGVIRSREKTETSTDPTTGAVTTTSTKINCDETGNDYKTIVTTKVHDADNKMIDYKTETTVAGSDEKTTIHKYAVIRDDSGMITTYTQSEKRTANNVETETISVHALAGIAVATDSDPDTQMINSIGSKVFQSMHTKDTNNMIETQLTYEDNVVVKNSLFVREGDEWKETVTDPREAGRRTEIYYSDQARQSKLRELQIAFQQTENNEWKETTVDTRNRFQVTEVYFADENKQTPLRTEVSNYDGGGSGIKVGILAYIPSGTNPTEVRDTKYHGPFVDGIGTTSTTIVRRGGQDVQTINITNTFSDGKVANAHTEVMERAGSEWRVTTTDSNNPARITESFYLDKEKRDKVKEVVTEPAPDNQWKETVRYPRNPDLVTEVYYADQQKQTKVKDVTFAFVAGTNQWRETLRETARPDRITVASYADKDKRVKLRDEVSDRYPGTQITQKTVVTDYDRTTPANKTVVETTYNNTAVSQKASETTTFWQGATATSTIALTYQYDTTGRQTSETKIQTNLTMVEKTQRGAFGRVTRYTVPENVVTINSETKYTYNSNGSMEKAVIDNLKSPVTASVYMRPAGAVNFASNSSCVLEKAGNEWKLTPSSSNYQVYYKNTSPQPANMAREVITTFAGDGKTVRSVTERGYAEGRQNRNVVTNYYGDGKTPSQITETQTNGNMMTARYNQLGKLTFKDETIDTFAANGQRLEGARYTYAYNTAGVPQSFTRNVLDKTGKVTWSGAYNWNGTCYSKTETYTQRSGWRGGVTTYTKEYAVFVKSDGSISIEEKNKPPAGCTLLVPPTR